MLAFGSDAEERKTTNGKKKEGVDDGESRDVSSGSPSWSEPVAQSADYRPKENTKKPVVPSRDEGEKDSGKQDASASQASGEVWQTQVRGVFWGRVREDGRRQNYCGNKRMKGTRKPVTHEGG
ncbi:hypothetical protein NDU88_007126 [Pleurodeles waltl]|uniref:Uncharacterized protein n=1 Tax=Pleurodeles waltl TaxID=8319 RepID=A0AAV7MF78_PLEWA|nr:hypothetical protein NDU88_007126 [Pleurodeles waltl]